MSPRQDTGTVGPSGAGRDHVVRVVDGDTVDLASGQTVRLLGIDTPERDQCGYVEATESLRELLEGATVSLERGSDGPNTDPYDRLLRYVFVDGTDAGLVQIEAGWANARYDSRDGYPRHRYERAYRAADEATGHRCPDLD